jgi:tetratricopeptide (TPR) repeat protein
VPKPAPEPVRERLVPPIPVVASAAAAPKAAKAVAKPAPVQPLFQPQAPVNPLAGKVDGLLARANDYVRTAQYDKAIATAESALELDPSSHRARNVLANAKARQMEALRSGTIVE